LIARTEELAMLSRFSLALLLIGLTCATPANGQFRRGLFGESTEIMLSPIEPPALLLPAGSVELTVRNSSTAPARIVERVTELLGRQLSDNDSRLSIVPKAADFVIVATLTEWSEARRNSTKYVSETRQVGTKQVTDKNGKTRTEPVYEYGRNKPSVVINASAGVRVEVRRRSGGAAIADETARHSVQEEHLVEAGPPTREAIEDLLIDNAVRKAAGRVSPGREPVRVLLARSDDVDKLNAIAQSRRWQEWLSALEAVKPNRDRKKDSYRVHNLAVAHEAMAYEATALEEQTSRLALAKRFVTQAFQQNPEEKYIVESESRIHKNTTGYEQLAALYQKSNTIPTTAPTSQRVTPAATGATASSAASAASSSMTNKDVIDLRVAGLDDENLIASIKEAKSVNFDLSPAGLKALLTAKVSNRVITAMRARAQ
jgi:hypothetical protein